MLDSGDQVWRKQSPEGRRRQLTAFLLPFEDLRQVLRRDGLRSFCSGNEICVDVSSVLFV